MVAGAKRGHIGRARRLVARRGRSESQQNGLTAYLGMIAITLACVVIGLIAYPRSLLRREGPGGR